MDFLNIKNSCLDNSIPLDMMLDDDRYEIEHEPKI